MFLAFISLCFGEHRSVVSGGDIGRAANNLRSLAERYSHARFHVLLRRFSAEEAFHVLSANAVFENVSSFDVGFVRVPVVAEVRVAECALLNSCGELERVARFGEDFFQARDGLILALVHVNAELREREGVERLSLEVLVLARSSFAAGIHLIFVIFVLK